MPFPPSCFASASPPSWPPLKLSVATKLTTCSVFTPLSKTTTGTFAFTAEFTGRTSACESSGARQMPLTLRAVKFSTSAICWSRSSSLSGPFQMRSTVMPCVFNSSTARSPPAWTLFQNSCVVPFGIIAMVYFSAAKVTVVSEMRAVSVERNFMRPVLGG